MTIPLKVYARPHTPSRHVAVCLTCGATASFNTPEEAARHERHNHP